MTGPDSENLPWLPRRFDEAMDVRRHRTDVERLLAKVAQARRDLRDARAESERRHSTDSPQGQSWSGSEAPPTPQERAAERRLIHEMSLVCYAAESLVEALNFADWHEFNARRELTPSAQYEPIEKAALAAESDHGVVLDESTITVLPTAAGGAVTFAQGRLTGPGAQQDDKPVWCLYAGGKLVAFGPEELNSLNHLLFRLNLDRARQGW